MQLQQFAVTATATSSYGKLPGSSWNASNAIGAPTISVCGDNRSAWASKRKDTIETLTVTFATPVIPQELAIVQNFKPGYVTKVTMSGAGREATVYSGPAAPQTTCPYTMLIPITGVDFRVNSASITVDQTSLKNWTEIDAVRLTGTP